MCLEVDDRIVFGLNQSCGNRGTVGRVSVFELRWCGWCRWGWGLEQGLERWGGVMSVWVVSPDYVCRWQIQVSVYFARRIPPHLRCTPCSILLHPIAPYFLWHISQIQTSLCVIVGSGFVRHHPLLWGAAPAIQSVEKR